MANLLIDSVIKTKFEKGKIHEKVLWINDQQVVTIELEDKRALPKFQSRADIELAISTKRSQIIPYRDKRQLLLEENLDDKSKEIQNTRYKIIEPLVSLANIPGIFIDDERGPLISELVEAGVSTKASIYKWLRAYWKGGKAGLLPNWDQCGKWDRDTTKNRQRPGRKPAGKGITVTTEIKLIFDDGIRIYQEGRSKTGKKLQTAFDEMTDQHFSYRCEETNELKYLDASQRPTFNQFAYYYRRQRKKDLVNFIKAEVSESEYNRKFRPVTGNSAREAWGPGSIVQIDSWDVPIKVVCRHDRRIGAYKVTVHLVKCVWSTFILGVAPEIDGRTALGASMAIASIPANKVDLCRAYGLKVEPEDWPVKDIMPIEMVADLGETAGKAPEMLIEHKKLRLLNLPGARPELKAHVEQEFNLLKEDIIHELPGAIIKDKYDNTEQTAVINLQELMQIVLLAIIKHNNTRVLNTKLLDVYAHASGVERNPLALWNWGLENSDASGLRTVLEDEARLLLLPAEEGSIYRDGIHFRGIEYVPVFTDSESLFILHANSNSKAKVKKAKIHYNPWNVNSIWMWEESSKSFIECHLKAEFQHFIGFTFKEAEDFYKDESDQEDVAINKAKEANMNFRDKVRSIVKAAQAEKRRQLEENPDTKTGLRAAAAANKRSDIESTDITRYGKDINSKTPLTKIQPSSQTIIVKNKPNKQMVESLANRLLKG